MIKALLAFLCSFALLGGYLTPAGAQQAVTSTDGLIELLRQAVQKQYQIPGHDVLIVWSDDTLEKNLAKAGQQASVRIPDQELEKLIGRPYLMLEIYEKGVFKRKISIKVLVDGWKEAFVTAREVGRGEVLADNNVKKVRRLISDLPKHFLVRADDIYGQEASRNLPGETILTSREVKARPIVFRGEAVKVRVINGTLTLMAEGVAQENGAKGQRIRVKIMTFSAAKMVLAQVTGTGEVLLEVK